jgi:hypothetical protein
VLTETEQEHGPWYLDSLTPKRPGARVPRSQVTNMDVGVESDGLKGCKPVNGCSYDHHATRLVMVG